MSLKSRRNLAKKYLNTAPKIGLKLSRGKNKTTLSRGRADLKPLGHIDGDPRHRAVLSITVALSCEDGLDWAGSNKIGAILLGRGVASEGSETTAAKCQRPGRPQNDFVNCSGVILLLEYLEKA